MKLKYVVNRDGTTVPVRVFAGGECALPLLMFHGLQSHSGWFARTGAFLSKAGYSVYGFDRRGSGLSTAPRGCCTSFLDILSDALHVAEDAFAETRADRIHLFGHCFGALPAMAFAARFPELCSSIVLSSPAVRTHVRPSVWELGLQAVRQVASGTSQVAVPFSVSELSSHHLAQRWMKADPLALSETDLQTYIEVLRLKRYIQQERAFLQQLPLLALFAEDDPIVNVESSIEYLRSLTGSGATIKRYHGALHLLDFSPVRQQYRQDALDWLQDIDRKNQAISTSEVGEAL